VKKYVKKAVKSLKSIETEYPKSDGSNFWVAELEVSKLHAENGSNKIENVIIGCIGLKAVKNYQKKVVDSTAIRNEDGDFNSANNLNYSIENEYKNKNENEENLSVTSAESRAEVSHMCVAHTHRRHGIARALLTTLLNWAGRIVDLGPDIVETQKTADPRVPQDLKVNLESHRESNVKTKIFNETLDEENSMRLKKRFSTVDLTVLVDLTAAQALYRLTGFREEGPPVDLGGNCYLQHMSIKT
jgi:ribosomal protein S18 acetylase RimI-like enzyme